MTDLAACFTCAPTSPISRMLPNLPTSATTTPMDKEVSGNCSIIPFRLATSMYPFSKSFSVKYLSLVTINLFYYRD